jgi:formylglycine-generating enzyme required for sulfatase activity
LRNIALADVVTLARGDERLGPLWVSRSKITAGLAAEVFNAAGIGETQAGAYRYVNIFNPDAPLARDLVGGLRCAPGRDTNPVTAINWRGACLLAMLLGGRLPTRAEWASYAAPAISLLETSPLDYVACANVAQSRGDTTPVDDYPAIGGLLDPLGNVCEWTLDRYCGASGVAWGERCVAGVAWSTPRTLLGSRMYRGKWERIGTRSIGARVVWEKKSA